MKCHIKLVSLIAAILWKSALSMAGMALPGCRERCGNVSIPYPFGIGNGCYLDPAYEIVYNSSKAFLSSLNTEVEHIKTPNKNYFGLGEVLTVQTITVKTPVQKTCGMQKASINISLDLSGTPYRFLGDGRHNVLVVGGCGSNVIMRNRSNQILGGCSSFCDKARTDHIDKVVIASCAGIGCCIIDVNDDASSSILDMYRLNVYNTPTNSNNCTSTMFISRDAYIRKLQHHDDDDSISLPNNSHELSVVPTVLNWFVVNSSGIVPSSDDKRRRCYTSKKIMEKGIWCECISGQNGNPYIPYGCHALSSKCENCQQGVCYQTDSAKSDSWHCYKGFTWKAIVAPSVTLIGFVIGIMAACSGNFYVCVRKRKQMKMKEKFFQQNGGVLLKQQLTLYGGTESAKIFKAVALKTATNNYSLRFTLFVTFAFCTLFNALV